MSVRDNKQPYMVYEGPLPRRHARPEPLVTETAPSDDDRVDTRSRGHGLGVALVVVGALAMGVAIGLWAAPNLRGTEAAPAPEQAPLALSLTQPTEAPLREAIDVPTPTIEPTVEEPSKAVAVSKPVRAKPVRVAQAPQRARKVARNDVVATPKVEKVVRTRAPRAELADWLAGEKAAPSPPSEPAGVHADPVAELIATSNDPPHL
jgi:hypothetical protein